jgi:hypothetical protein
MFKARFFKKTKTPPNTPTFSNNNKSDNIIGDFELVEEAHMKSESQFLQYSTCTTVEDFRNEIENRLKHLKVNNVTYQSK